MEQTKQTLKKNIGDPKQFVKKTHVDDQVHQFGGSVPNISLLKESMKKTEDVVHKMYELIHE